MPTGTLPGRWRCTPAAGILSTFDAGRANIALVYDALLGGKDNYAADRAEAARLLALYPDLRQQARENRLFLATAVRWLAAECGIRQYLDLGSGLPADGSNTRQAVHAVSPACGVAYVDIDPVAVAHADALVPGQDAAGRRCCPATCRPPRNWPGSRRRRRVGGCPLPCLTGRDRSAVAGRAR